MLKRFVAIALMIVSLTLSGCCEQRSWTQVLCGQYSMAITFRYPNGWIAVNVSGGADAVFRDLIEETENVSVVVSPVPGDTALTDLGDPKEVAQNLFSP